MNNTEIPKFRFSDNSSISKKVGAVVLAAGLVTSGVSVGEEVKSEIRIEGDMPSQNPDLLSKSIDYNRSEVNDPTSSEITDEYKREVVNQILDFMGSEVAPIPTEKIRNIFNNWEEENFGPYRQELRNLGADNEKRIISGAKALFAYDRSGELEVYGANDDKFQNYITRQEIIDFVLTGKHEDAITDKNGNVVWLITADKKADKKIKQGFKDAIDWFVKNGAPDVLESSCNNGLCIIFSSNTVPDRSAASTFVSEYGVIWQNMDSENIKKINLRNITISNLFIEPYGIKYLQYFISNKYNYNLGNWMGYSEVVKGLIASCVGFSLNDKEGIYQIFAEDFKLGAEDWGKQFSISEADGKRQILAMADFIDPIGYDSLWKVEGFRELVDLTKEK